MRKIRCETCPTRSRGAICDLPAEALKDFQLAGSTALYKPRQVVFSEGAPPSGLYLVCSGSLKLFHSDRFGREHILEIAGPGAILGELSLDEGPPVSISAEAVTETQLCFLARERLVPFLERHPQTAIRLIIALSAELASARRKVRDLALKGAESRLAGLLVQLARVNGSQPTGQVQLGCSRRDLAEMVGVSTETAIRLLGKLKQKHAITVERRDITITDFDKLTKLANYDEIEA
jgi:CRP/FNR family transcriptional regulator, polysaccharide utilization system transcription regulator